MRRALMLLVLAGCSDPAKDREIAALKARLAEKDKPVEVAKPAIAPATATPDPDPDPAEDEEPEPGDLAIAKGAPGEMTGEWLTKLVAAASANRSITYAQLKKNAEKYDGKAWMFSGRVLEISEKPMDGVMFTVARISLDYYGNQPVYVMAPFSTDFVEENGVDVAGFLTGTHRYTSQAGWNLAIPSIAARSIVKYGALAKMRPAGKKPRSARLPTVDNP